MDLALPKQNYTTILIIVNDEMKHFIELIKSLEGSRLLLKRVSKTIQNEAKEQKGRFLSILLSTLGASLLGNILVGEETIAKSISVETTSRSQG